jgi:hypothetical protein
MSEASLLDIPSQAQLVIPLLGEYAEKLREIFKAMRRMRRAGQRITGRLPAEKDVQREDRLEREVRLAEFDFEKRRLMLLLPPAKELSRFVSQMVEHSPLDDVVRIELRLRLAEFEAALHIATRISSWNLSASPYGNDPE